MLPVLRAAGLAAAIALVSPVTVADDCVDCHRDETPNIVNDWQISRHHSEDVACNDCHRGRHAGIDVELNEARAATLSR